MGEPLDHPRGRRISAQSWRRIAALIGLLVLGIVVALILRSSGEVSPARIQREVLGLGSFGLLGFLAASLLRPLLVVFSGSLFAIAAGLIWGLWLGTGIALLGSFLSSILVFLVARRLGTSAIRELAGPRYHTFELMARRRGFAFVFVATLGYLIPGDLVVAVATVSGMKARSVLGASLLGNAPGALLMAGIGSAVIEPSPALWWIAGGAVVLLSGIAVFLVRAMLPRGLRHKRVV